MTTWLGISRASNQSRAAPLENGVWPKTSYATQDAADRISGFDRRGALPRHGPSIDRRCRASRPGKHEAMRIIGLILLGLVVGARRFANHLDFQLQLDDWFAKANARTHKTLRCRPIDRLLEERERMRALPDAELDL